MDHDFSDLPPLEDFSDFPSLPAPLAPQVSGFNYEALEKRWKVNRRTLYRWKKLGVNLRSPRQIAAHVAAQQSSAPAAVAAAIEFLSR